MSQNPSPDTLRFAVLAADVVLFTLEEGVLKVLLMSVDRPPYFDGVPGFPGGLLRPDETAQESAARQLREKGGVDPAAVYLEQLYTFSRVDRDPRGRVVSVAYLGLMPATRLPQKQRQGTWWCATGDVPHLAYDHDEILRTAHERLRSRVTYTNIIGQLLPETFTLTELQRAYEVILSRDLDKRNFRKKIQDAGLVEPTGKKRRGQAHRPAALYRMKHREVREIDLL